METINRINFYELSDRLRFSPELLLKIYKENFPVIPKDYLYELNNREIEIMEMLIYKYGNINQGKVKKWNLQNKKYGTIKNTN